jgi:hypothetical protein
MKFNKKLHTPMVAALLAASVSPLWAADRVLIMGISQYEGVIGAQKVQDLPGISFDILNAQKIAQKLGFNTENATILREADLRKDNFIQNFEKFTASVKNSDRVFVYYTGHGMRAVDTDGKCKEGFIASDSRLIEQDTISEALANLKNRAKEVTAIFDSCHAGGVAAAAGMRATGVTKSAGVASEWVIKGGPAPASVTDVCAIPTNYLTRAIGKIKNESGAQGLDKNFTYIAAAKASEYAIAGSKGSVATNTILGCLNNGVAVPNAGTATVQDLLNCAQSNVNQQIPNIKLHNTAWQGMTITAAGNTARPLWDVATKVEAQKPVNVLPNSKIPDAQPAKFNEALAAMRSLEADADKRWGLRVHDIPTEVEIGTKFKVPYSAAQGGYFYILAASSDGKQFNLAYPPANQQRYRVSTVGNIGGDPPHGTGADAYIQITGPAADNHFLVIVSPQPKSFSNVVGLAAISEVARGTGRGAIVAEETGTVNANPLAGTTGAAYFVVKGR